MPKGTYPGPIQPLSAVLPGLEERPSGQPIVGLQHVVTKEVCAATAASTNYTNVVFIAPSDGWYVEDVFVTAITAPDYASATLAIENYDKSGSTGKNLLSATNFNLETITAKKGTQLTLSATQVNREMDEGDVIDTTVAIGASEVTAGANIVVTVVLRGPEVDPQ